METPKYVNKVSVTVNTLKDEVFITMYQDSPELDESGNNTGNISDIHGRFVMSKAMAKQFTDVIANLFEQSEEEKNNG